MGPTVVFNPVAGDHDQLSKPPVLITSKTVGPEEHICIVSLALTSELPPMRKDGPVRSTDSSTSDKFKTFTNLNEACRPGARSPNLNEIVIAISSVSDP